MFRFPINTSLTVKKNACVLGMYPLYREKFNYCLHSRSDIRHKNTQQSNNLITLSIFLQFLVTSMNHLTRQPPTSRKYMKPCVCREMDLTLQRNPVLLMGDSHIRSFAERLAIKLRSSFRTTDYVKPMQTLTLLHGH